MEKSEFRCRYLPPIKLGLSEGAVRNYLSEAMTKLGASNRVEA
jgi:hypothetical protein